MRYDHRVKIDRHASRPPLAAGADTRLLVHVVAREESVRERLSAAVVGTPNLRVVSSETPDNVASSTGVLVPDAIIAYADTAGDCHRIHEFADRHPDAFVVLVVSDVDWPAPRLDTSSINHVERAPADVVRDTLVPLVNGYAQDHAATATPVANLRAGDQAMLDRLTPREREILSFTAEGLSIEEIAQRIQRAFATVAKHRNNIMAKTGLRDRVALTRFAIRTGLASP